MSIDKLGRVMWRLRRNNPNNYRPTWTELKRAIMYECGTDPLTYRNNRNALITLGWIKTYAGKRLQITDKDLTGDDRD